MKSWPVPDCLKSIQQFLGFVGYYRRFIPNFADLAEPLVSLTGKDVPFVWRPACATAFTGLRDALVRAPILAFPTEHGDYILDTDASNFGLGGVLSQIQDNVECVIAYCSRALRLSQRKYCTTKREMLAAVSMCIRDWRGASGHLHISAVRCGCRCGCGCGPIILIAGRVRAPALSVTAGLCGHVLHICGPMRSNDLYCFQCCNREDVSLHQRSP